jgi:hypothetical protein
MKISPGWWLVYVSIVYSIACIINIWFYKFSPIEYIQFAYCLVLGLPLWIPPLAHWVGVKTFWRL